MIGHTEGKHRVLLGTLRSKPPKKVKHRPALKHVFLANNYDRVLSCVEGLATELPWLELEFCQPLRRAKKAAINDYLEESWGKQGEQRKVSQILANMAFAELLSDKQRETVKKRFKYFNEAFDARIKEERGYNIPSHDLWKEFLKMLEEHIVRAHAEFHKTHSVLKFTKHRDKYIRYSPEDVRSHVDSLFTAITED